MSGAIGAPELIVILSVFAVPVIFFWRIFSKAGYAGAMALLILIPLLNLIAMGILAFNERLIERQHGQAQKS
ncbi:MAG: hypothetical protein ACE5IW_13815 [bacterium]